MKKADKIRITKCYLIEICDKDDKALDSDFSFLNYHDTKIKAEKMKDDYNSNKNPIDSKIKKIRKNLVDNIYRIGVIETDEFYDDREDTHPTKKSIEADLKNRQYTYNWYDCIFDRLDGYFPADIHKEFFEVARTLFNYIEAMEGTDWKY